MIIQLKNDNNILKTCKVGFCWTMFFASIPFCGGLIPLFRGSVKWFILYYVLGIFTLGIAIWVLFFTYNSIYIKELLEKGYKPVDEKATSILKAKGWIA